MSVKSLFFTKDALIKITTPSTKQDVYRDTKQKGLFLVASYGGSKTFYFGKKIKNLYHKIRIGRFPDLSVMEAREKATELKSQIAKGANPMEEKKVQITNSSLIELTFKELFDKYINDYAKHNNTSWQDTIDEVNRHAKRFYPIKISAISKADIQEWFIELTKVGKYTANKTLARLKAIFNKAIEWELISVNPTFSIKKHKEKSRDRYLIREEIAGFFKAVKEETNPIMQDFILVALFTGARKDNVLTMRWEHVSFADKKWYIPNTKNGEPHTVTLSDVVIKILNRRKKESNNSEWVFPSKASKTGHLVEPKKAIKRVCKKAGIVGLRIHDLRRSHASWMAITGASQYVIGKALNHKDSRSTEAYTKLNWNPVREFVEKATDEIMSIAAIDIV